MSPKNRCLFAHTFSATLLIVLLAASLTSLAATTAQRIVIATGSISGSAYVGKTYNRVLTVTGGTAPYQFSISSGALPTGLTLNSSTGSISGTPTTAGVYSFRVAVTDLPRPDKGDRLLSITVLGNVPPSGIVVTPATVSLAPGATQQFSATSGGTTTQAVTWRASFGEISKTGLYRAPKVSSTTSVTITATSLISAAISGTAVVTISGSNPSPNPVSVVVSPSSASLASGGTQQFTALVSNTSNTSVTWRASAGSISSSGLFTAPKVSANTAVTVTATSVADPTASSSAAVSITTGGPSPLTITTSALPGGVSGTPYGISLGASGGTSPYTWSMSSGSLPSGISLSSSGTLSGTTSQTGQFSFVAQVADSSAAIQHATQSLTLTISSSQPTGSMDGPAQLPRVFLQTTLANTPANGQIWNVNNATALQQTLNSAACGDTIMVQSGVVYTGTFTFPQKSCDSQHWIIVRTSAPDTALPPEGVRLTPCYAGVTSLPGRPALNCSSSQKVLPTIVYNGTGQGPIVFANGANHYRLLGLEITRTVGTGPSGALVSTGVADSLVFDRLYLHGTPNDETRHGIQLGASTNVAAVDSYFSDFHCTSVTGTCTDAQAISGGNSNGTMGPYKIVNNFLEASGENILFGGGPSTATPTDIEIRRNHLFKPMTWLKGQAGFVGGTSGNPFMVKNHFELKNAQRVLFEGNILENNWGGFSQSGFSIQLTPKNQYLNGTNVCPICQVTDVTIRYNTISHVGGGIVMATVGSSVTGGIAYAGGRYSLHDVTIDDIDASKYIGSGTLFLIMNSWPTNVLNSISINHITGFTDATAGHLLSLGNLNSNPKMTGFSFTNNLVASGRYPVWNVGFGTNSCSASNIPSTTIPVCFTPYGFSSNAIVGAPSAFPAAAWPGGNFFPAAATNVQFTSYNNAIGGNYQLLSSSPYKNAASDGKDIGADITALQSATAGVY